MNCFFFVNIYLNSSKILLWSLILKGFVCLTYLLKVDNIILLWSSRKYNQMLYVYYFQVVLTKNPIKDKERADPIGKCQECQWSFINRTRVRKHKETQQGKFMKNKHCT